MYINSGDGDDVGEGPGDSWLTREIGNQMRAVRKQQRLSLQAVEQLSGGAFKAVVVGSYERGDRSVSVSRLSDLARFYGVPVTDLLPAGSVPAAVLASRQGDQAVVINLRRLRELPADQVGPVDRFVRAIQHERGDYTTDVLSLRSDDLRPLAIMYSTTPDQLLVTWREAGILIPAD